METQTTQTNTQETTLTAQTNTTFVDQASDHVEYAQQKPIDLPAPQVIPDEHWFAAMQLAKPVVIKTVQWQSTDIFNKTLWTATIPNLISDIDSLQQRTLRMYAYYRLNPILRVQLNGTPFHLGQLLLGFIPFNLRQDTETVPFLGGYSAIGLTGFPSLQISAADCESSELRIPFVHLYDYLTTNETNDVELGVVCLKVLNPLRFAAGSSPSLTLTISLFCENPEVHVPMYDHNVLYDTTSFDLCEPTGLFSNMGAAVGHLTTGNLKGFFNSGSKAQKDVADLFDKPSYPSTPQKTISPLSAMSHGKGTETTIRLGLDPTAMSAQPIECFGGVENEMTISHIAQTPLLFHQFTWTDTQLPSTLLTSFLVNPLLSYSDNADIFQPTFLAWVSSMYTYWRGGIKLHFDIISTKFHSARMLIAFDPNVGATTPTLEQAFSCPNIIVDIKTTSTVDFIVPFLSNLPYKTVENSDSSSSAVGRIFVYVLNQLVHPDNVSPEIDVNMYISADEDFELSVPANFPLYHETPPSLMCEPTGGISQVQETITEKTDTPITLGFGPSRINRINRFGEDFPLVDYIKRYGECDPMDGTGTIKVEPAVNRVLLNSANYYTPVAAVGALFATWYGAMRYKFIFDQPRTSQHVVTFAYNPMVPANQPLRGDPFQTTATAQDVGVEIEIPCYVNTNIIVVPQILPIADDTYTQSGYINFQQTGDPPTTPTKTYKAAGDDLRFYYLISPPTCSGPLFSVLS